MKKNLSAFLASFLLLIMAINVSAATPNGVDAEEDEGENKMVRLYPFTDKDGKFGYMNNKGEVIINPQFDFADIFSNGRARVASITGLRYKWGYIDEKGKLIIPMMYYTATNFENDNAAVTLPNDLSVMQSYDTIISHLNTTTLWFDTDGKCFLKSDYDYGGPFNIDDLAHVMPVDPPWEGEGYGFINRKGDFAFPTQYKNAGGYSEGLAAVDNGSKEFGASIDDVYGHWGYIDKTGKMVIEAKYNNVGSFSEGLAPVAVGKVVRTGSGSNFGKYGFINKTGEMVIPAQYEDAYSFEESLARVKKNGKWGFVDITGKEIIGIKYNYVNDFSDGLAAVAVGEFAYDENGLRVSLGKWGFIDKTGKMIIEPQYDQVDDCINGLIAVRSREFNHETQDYEILYYIDKKGNKIVPQI